MGIDFGQIHNIVRTYQKVLDLDEPAPAKPEHASPEEDRISISKEAKQLMATTKSPVTPPDSENLKPSV